MMSARWGHGHLVAILPCCCGQGGARPTSCCQGSKFEAARASHPVSALRLVKHMWLLGSPGCSSWRPLSAPRLQAWPEEVGEVLGLSDMQPCSPRRAASSTWWKAAPESWQRGDFPSHLALLPRSARWHGWLPCCRGMYSQGSFLWRFG